VPVKKPSLPVLVHQKKPPLPPLFWVLFTLRMIRAAANCAYVIGPLFGLTIKILVDLKDLTINEYTGRWTLLPSYKTRGQYDGTWCCCLVVCLAFDGSCFLKCGHQSGNTLPAGRRFQPIRKSIAMRLLEATVRWVVDLHEPCTTSSAGGSCSGSALMSLCSS
jgi:hypothetical protein